MPTQRDYMIATVLGEDNRGSPQGQAAIIDSIFNRQAAILSGKRAPGYYEAKSPSIQDIVTANNGNQYNTWKGTPAEAGNAARAARALQGRDATSGTERQQYDQIAKIYDDYLAGEGGWQGISQGATFYQTPKSADDGSFQNKFYRDGSGNQNYQDIGSHRFSGEPGQYFKDKGAFYAANPQMYNPTTGAGYDPSSPLNPGISTQGPGDFFGSGNGSLGNSDGTVETGSPYGFSQGNFSAGVGDGSLGAGIIPNQDITRFGQGFDPSGGLDPMGGLGSFQGTFNAASYLQANPDVAAAGVDPLQHWLRYGQAEGRPLTADFSGGTMDLPSVQGGPNVSAGIGLGGFNLDGFGFQQPQMAGLDGLSPLGSVDTPAPISADFSGSPLSPVDPGNPIATPAPITADFGSPLAAVPTGPSVSQGVAPGTFQGTFNGADYLAANQDLAGFNVDPLQHYLTYGYQEGRALDLAGDRIGQGFDPSQYLQANPDVAASGVSPLQHYLQYGAHEGRATDFSGGVAPASFGAGITPNAPAPSATGFSASNVSQGVDPGSFRGTFNGADYLAANQDLAGFNIDPLQHYLTYGYQEGRALDTAGDRINQGFDPSAYMQANPDAAASGVSALQHYIQYGAHEGRATNFSGGVAPGSFGAGIVPAPSMQSPMDYGAFGSIDTPAPIAGGNFGADLSPVSTGPNVSAGVGNGTFRGTFNGADYLAANPDVAAAHVDPLQHYLTSGYNEGRALDVQGDRINQGFNPSQYFNANPDAAASGVSALQHYIQYGAHEGRAADFSGGVSPGNFGAGITPYAPAPGPMDFSGSNVGQGLGPTGNGAFGLPQSTPSIPDFGAGYNVSGGVQNGGFGLNGVMSGNYGGGGFNPYGFSGANVGGGLGAQPQSMGGYYPAGNSQGGGLDPYGFSQANVGGFDANSLGGGAPVEDFGSGAGLGPTQWNDAPQAGGDGGGGASGFDHNASELAFLRGQLDQQYAANARLADSNNTNIAFANQGAAQAAQLNAAGAGNAAKQFAGIQAGLGIAPVAGVSFAPGPVGIQTIGGIGPMNFGMAGLGGAPLRGFL